MNCSVRVLAAAVSSAALSCGSGARSPAPPVKQSGPIVSLAIGSSIDGNGRLVSPRFTFDPSDSRMTVVIRVGETHVTPLRVRWYVNVHNSARMLFEHQIDVRSNSRAFSVGTNPGSFLLSGSYTVVATLGDDTKSLRFDVARVRTTRGAVSSGLDDERVAARLGSLRIIAWSSVSGTTALTQSAPSTTPGQPPASGESGIAPDYGTNPFVEFPESCGVSFTGSVGQPGGVREFLDPGADVADIDADGKCRTSARINVMATVSGPPKKVGAFYTTAGPDHYSSATFMADPCWLGGGSDLPGTRVLVSGDFGGMPGTEGAVSHDITITLGPDTLAPTVTVTPASGDVREGETIHLKVTAREERDKGPWQTGVKRIQVSANHGDVVKEPWVNAADRASQQCAGKTWEQAYDVSYVVPPNPPSPIKLCALAEDYAGNPGYECAEFTVIQPDRFVWRGHIEDEYASVGRALSGGGVPRMPEPATFAYEVDVNFEYVQQKLADGSTAWPRRHIDWNLQGTTGDDTVTHRCAGNGSLDLAPASESAALTRDELDKLEAQCETTHASTSFRLYGSLPTSPPLPKIPSISALDENCRYREETGRRRMSVSLTPCPRHTASR